MWVPSRKDNVDLFLDLGGCVDDLIDNACRERVLRVVSNDYIRLIDELAMACNDLPTNALPHLFGKARIIFG